MWLPSIIRNKLKWNAMRRFYRQFVSSGDLCFDIGANLGERTEVLLSLGAKVVAVDPQKSCCEHLQRRFSQNPNFTLVEAGLGSSSGMLTFYACAEHNECATFSRDFMDAFSGNLHFSSVGEIQVLTLEDLVQTYGRPKFCKVDTEGFEMEVVKGMVQPPHFLALEFNQPLIQKTKDCVVSLSRFQQARYNLMPWEEMRAVWPEWIKAEMLLNQFETRLPAAIKTGELLVRF